jgi:hypothetical protein
MNRQGKNRHKTGTKWSCSGVMWQKMKMLADFKNRVSSTTHIPKEGSFYFIYTKESNKKYRSGVRSHKNWF